MVAHSHPSGHFEARGVQAGHRPVIRREIHASTASRHVARLYRSAIVRRQGYSLDNLAVPIHHFQFRRTAHRGIKFRAIQAKVLSQVSQFGAIGRTEQIPADRKVLRIEILDGSIVATPVPGVQHITPVRRFRRRKRRRQCFFIIIVAGCTQPQNHGCKSRFVPIIFHFSCVWFINNR